jgi:hypothetical protein
MGLSVSAVWRVGRVGEGGTYVLGVLSLRDFVAIYPHKFDDHTANIAIIQFLTVDKKITARSARKHMGVWGLKYGDIWVVVGTNSANNRHKYWEGQTSADIPSPPPTHHARVRDWR